MKQRRIYRLTVSFCLPAVLVLGCSPSQSPPDAGAPSARPPHYKNVIIIQTDTTRADRLGSYGYRAAHTPNLDRLAEEGVRFDQHFVNATYTAASVPSLLTGNLQDRHGLRYQGDRLADSNETLPERFQAAGYRTAGFLANPLLHPDRNYTQGLDLSVTRGNHEGNEAGPMVDMALQWLDENHEAPFFLWVFLIDPHFPYTPPDRFAALHEDTGRIEESVSWQWEHLRADLEWDIESVLWGDLATDAQVRQQSALYDAEISYADAEIGRLLSRLDALGISGNTLVVYTSDHGEELNEHGFFCGHGYSTYEPGARVPLIIRAPGASAGEVPQVVRHVDIAPTILDWAGLSGGEGMDGRSLRPLISGEAAVLPPMPAYVENHPLSAGPANPFQRRPRMYITGVPGAWRALRTEDWKLIRIPHPEGDHIELYDMRSDPDETRNVYGAHSDEAANLLETLSAIEARTLQQGDTDPGGLDDETVEALKALGYLGEGDAER